MKCGDGKSLARAAAKTIRSLPQRDCLSDICARTGKKPPGEFARRPRSRRDSGSIAAEGRIETGPEKYSFIPGRPPVFLRTG